MKNKTYRQNSFLKEVNPVGFFLLNLFAFVFILSTFSTSFSHQSLVYSKLITEPTNELGLSSPLQYNKINADSELYFEGSEVLEIDDFENSKSTQSFHKNLANTLLFHSICSLNKQQTKLYITFCCLRIHLA